MTVYLNTPDLDALAKRYQLSDLVEKEVIVGDILDGKIKFTESAVLTILDLAARGGTNGANSRTERSHQEAPEA